MSSASEAKRSITDLMDKESTIFSHDTSTPQSGSFVHTRASYQHIPKDVLLFRELGPEVRTEKYSTFRASLTAVSDKGKTSQVINCRAKYSEYLDTRLTTRDDPSNGAIIVPTLNTPLKSNTLYKPNRDNQALTIK
jgi:hypothetical protein